MSFQGSGFQPDAFQVGVDTVVAAVAAVYRRLLCLMGVGQ